jgi:hypothetical protein
MSTSPKVMPAARRNRIMLRSRCLAGRAAIRSGRCAGSVQCRRGAGSWAARCRGGAIGKGLRGRSSALRPPHRGSAVRWHRRPQPRVSFPVWVPVLGRGCPWRRVGTRWVHEGRPGRMADAAGFVETGGPGRRSAGRTGRPLRPWPHNESTSRSSWPPARGRQHPRSTRRRSSSPAAGQQQAARHDRDLAGSRKTACNPPRRRAWTAPPAHDPAGRARCARIRACRGAHDPSRDGPHAASGLGRRACHAGGLRQQP